MKDLKGKLVAELAKELNVSVQTIYKRLNKFETQFKDDSGRRIVSPDQENQIKNDLNPPNQENHTDEMVNVLIDQLKIKDETINKLTNLLNQEQVLHQKTQLQLENTQKQLEFKESEPEPENPPTNWWENLLKRFKM